jgi:hypothetical protein
LTPFDMKRLESYGNNLLELQIVVDLLPTLAMLYFGRRLRSADDESDMERELSVSGLSAALLLAIGLQRRSLDDIASELQIAAHQAHTLLCKAVRHMVQSLRALEKRDAEAVVDAQAPRKEQQKLWAPVAENLEEELADAGRDAVEPDAGQRAFTRELLNDTEMSKYAIAQDDDNAWKEAEARVRKMQDDSTGRSYSSTFSIRAPEAAQRDSESGRQDVVSSSKKKRSAPSSNKAAASGKKRRASRAHS